MEHKAIYCMGCSNMVYYPSEYETKHWALICPNCKFMTTLHHNFQNLNEKVGTALEIRKPTFIEKFKKWFTKKEKLSI